MRVHVGVERAGGVTGDGWGDQGWGVVSVLVQVTQTTLIKYTPKASTV